MGICGGSPAGAKALATLSALSARLKSCPVTKQPEQSFSAASDDGLCNKAGAGTPTDGNYSCAEYLFSSGKVKFGMVTTVRRRRTRLKRVKLTMVPGHRYLLLR